MAKKVKKPNPVQVIVRHAHRFGLDPAAVVAYMLEESGGRWNALGDHGTSFGPFQMHRGGALGSHSGAWAESPAGLIAGMRMMAQGGARGLRGEAAVRAIYVGFGKGTPRAIPKGIAQYGTASGLVGGASQTPDNTPIPAKGSVSPPNATPPLSGGLTPLNYTVPSLGPVGGPLGSGAPVDMGSFGKIPDVIRTVSFKAEPAQRLPPLKVEVDHGANAGTPREDSATHSLITEARKYLGTKYVFGGTTPAGFDCSGFAQYLYAKIGKNLPRVSWDQMKVGRPVSVKRLRAGDLVFFYGGEHEGIYIGGGKFIHAPHTGDVVKISPLAGYYMQHFTTARRVV